MSLDMTADAREAPLGSTDDGLQVQKARATPAWLADLMMVAATALGVMLCSALGVWLFLR